MKLGQKRLFCVVCCLKTVKITAYFYASRTNPTGKTRAAGESGDCWENTVGRQEKVDADVQTED